MALRGLDELLAAIALLTGDGIATAADLGDVAEDLRAAAVGLERIADKIARVDRQAEVVADALAQEEDR